VETKIYFLTYSKMRKQNMFARLRVNSVSYKFIAFFLPITLLSSQLQCATTTFPVPVGPMSIAAADFRGAPDGLDDLVVGSSGITNAPAVATVFLNDGNGNLSPSQEFTIFNRPYNLFVLPGDFSGTGKQDIMAIAPTNSLVNSQILVNDGIGNFTPGTQYSFGQRPIGAAVGKFRNIGLDDLVTINSSLTLLVAYNAGAGFFFFHPIDLAGFPTSVTVGDVNGDGVDDIIVTYGQLNQIGVFISDGVFDFAPGQNYDVGSFPVAAKVGMLGTSGMNDIAVVNGMDNTVSVLLNTGTGTFNTAVEYGVGKAPAAIALGNFAGNGNLDIAVANQGQSTVSFLVNNGDGTFQPKVDQDAGSGPFAITSGFFTPSSLSNNIPVIAVANVTAGTITVFDPIVSLVASSVQNEQQKFTQFAAHPNLMKEMMLASGVRKECHYYCNNKRMTLINFAENSLTNKHQL
jgi:hypothetical protein